MDYRNYIKSSNIDFSINNNLIECGETTWQIRNIAATSVGRKVVPFHEPEPIFNEPEPTLNLNLKSMLITSALAWIGMGIFSESLGFSIFIVLIVLGAFIIRAYINIDDRKEAWLSKKSSTEKRWEIWNKLRNNPLVLYSLMLETNAGSKPLFYSLDESQIAIANNAIKESMDKKENADVNFKIETVNIGGDESINNFCSSIHSQLLQEV
uniref:Uncharacterized protein n=1 Tax=Candidatus Kentrum sp. MB TaxID=2138164 RepID=A0A450XGG1_9GAMM|nr:MAG: hypothetical protein BECKMB1821G_GA0114241_103525 [Candidatus Kentron sp. MB]